MTSTTFKKSRSSPPIGVCRMASMSHAFGIRCRERQLDVRTGALDSAGIWRRARAPVTLLLDMRVLGQALVIGCLGTAAVAFTPACAENDQAIFIRTNLAPPQNRQNGTCLYSSDPTQAGLFEG